MTDTITSQNIDLSSLDTLYVATIEIVIIKLCVGGLSPNYYVISWLNNCREVQKSSYVGEGYSSRER